MYPLKLCLQGYGEGIAKLFAEEGATVLVADINEKAGRRYGYLPMSTAHIILRGLWQRANEVP